MGSGPGMARANPKGFRPPEDDIPKDRSGAPHTGPLSPRTSSKGRKATRSRIVDGALLSLSHCLVWTNVARKPHRCFQPALKASHVESNVPCRLLLVVRVRLDERPKLPHNSTSRHGRSSLCKGLRLGLFL